MHYKSIQIFQIKGLSPIEEGNIFNLHYSDGSAMHMNATFCANVDEHCSEIDRKHVIANLMLGGPWGLEDEFQIAIINKRIEELRIRRHKKYKKFATVVLEISTDFPDIELKHVRRFDDFIVSLDEIPTQELEKCRIATAHARNFLLSSLMLSLQYQIAIQKITEGSYYIDSENVHIYNYSLTGGGKSYSLEKVNEQTVLDMKNYLKILQKTPEFSKVCRLLFQAVDEKNDNLRSFIFAWISLEIFINKVFKEYEQQFICQLVQSCDLKTKNVFLDRVSSVMKDKYRLFDKFVIVSAYFADEDVDETLSKFQNIKKKRDDLFHGDDVSEDSLPLYDILKLIKSYFDKHLKRKFN